MVEMSVSRALSKLKTIDARLERIINDPRFKLFAVVKGDEVPPGYRSVEQFQREVGALRQSYLDLVAWKREVKRAVLRSNAQVTVQVAGESLTISEVIELKGSMVYEQKLLAAIRLQQTQAERQQEKDRNTVAAQLDAKLKDLPGITPEQIQSITPVPVHIFKAHGLDATVSYLEKFMNTMLSEIDAVLSETNARTMIEVPAEPTN